MKRTRIMHPHKLPNREDAMTVALRAQLCGISIYDAAREFLNTLPKDHPILNNQVKRMLFQTMLHDAEKKLLEDFKHNT